MKTIAEKIYINEGNTDVLRRIPVAAQFILDVGCGNGANASILAAQGKRVDGITLSPEELNSASPYLNHGFIHNLENGLPGGVLQNQYDAVLCSHVLEHIGDPAKLLRDILSALKPNGTLVVALPNIMHYKSRLQLARGNFPYQEAGIWDNTHYKWYTFKSGAEMLRRAGFLVKSAEVTGDLPFNRLWKRIFPAGLRSFVYRALTKTSRGLWGYQLLYTAIPAAGRN